MQLYNFFPNADLWVTHTIQHRPENVFNVCRRGTAKKNAMAQVPDGYLTALTNRELEMIEGGDWMYIVIDGKSVKIYIPKN